MKKVYLFLAALPLITIAYANSSWIWISEKRPWDILPWVILVTLAVEILAIRLLGGERRMGRIGIFVVLGNLISFLVPYLFKWGSYAIQGFEFDKYLNHAPSFIVGLGFLALTLMVELPLVYFALKPKDAPCRKLLWTIVGANIVTTVLTAIVEQILCKGQW